MTNAQQQTLVEEVHHDLGKPNQDNNHSNAKTNLTHSRFGFKKVLVPQYVRLLTASESRSLEHLKVQLRFHCFKLESAVFKLSPRVRVFVSPVRFNKIDPYQFCDPPSDKPALVCSVSRGSSLQFPLSASRYISNHHLDTILSSKPGRHQIARNTKTFAGN